MGIRQGRSNRKRLSKHVRPRPESNQELVVRPHIIYDIGGLEREKGVKEKHALVPPGLSRFVRSRIGAFRSPEFLSLVASERCNKKAGIVGQYGPCGLSLSRFLAAN